jgi:predicted nucleic acid-binding protein
VPELLTLDSSVIVSALRKHEEHSRECQSILERITDGTLIAYEPYTVIVEVAAAIKRRTGSQQLSERIVRDVLAIDGFHFISLGVVRAWRAINIAQRFSVRGMDSIVVQIAEEFKTTPVSLDTEMMENVKGIIPAQEPSSI